MSCEQLEIRGVAMGGQETSDVNKLSGDEIKRILIKNQESNLYFQSYVQTIR
jgi:hypothetical protein